MVAVMNGGIFEPGFVPSGLLVQDGVELTPINRNNGEGNFFLKPNGVFLPGPKGAAVITSGVMLTTEALNAFASATRKMPVEWRPPEWWLEFAEAAFQPS